MSHLVRLLTLAACAALGPAGATRLSAQQVQQPVSAQSDSRLRVFLDCDYCDFDFMRTEITFVDHVRNRQDSQVHILVTDQTTGGGGREFTLHFIGQRDLASLSDTLRYVSPPAASEDSRRRGLARVIKLGLVRYAARRSDSDRLEITYKVPAKSDARPTGPSKDRWNFWVFRTSASGYGSGEKTSNFVSLNGSFSATRTTEAWKMRLALNGNYGQSRFIFGDGERFNSYSHS
ncbi:MAG TPA: hypothetical protein VNJ04_13650 [Gemmatimonadaceae bacterium]|nr:hypothetical protein [Gemmatimonadaceae bacterium]